MSCYVRVVATSKKSATIKFRLIEEDNAMPIGDGSIGIDKDQAFARIAQSIQGCRVIGIAMSEALTSAPIRRWISTGRLKAIKTDGQWMIEPTQPNGH